MSHENRQTQPSRECPDKRAGYIDDYLLGKLSDAQMEEMEAHYFNCDICLREMQLREKLISHLRREEPDVPPESVPEHPGPARALLSNPLRLIGYIAAAVIVLLLLRWWMLPGPEGPESELETLERYAARYGDNFRPSPAFEDRMQTDRRTAPEQLNVLAPKNNALKQGSLNFQWQLTVPDNASRPQLQLNILDNRLYPLYQFPVENGSFTLEAQLPPGLFYWTLDSERETLYRGRFLVLPPDAVP